MKTIFEGVINGEKFDTVEAYNAKMRELRADPRNEIEAHTTTRLVADPDDQNSENRQVPETKEEPCTHSITTTPGFDMEDAHYLDVLIHGDDQDGQRLEEARAECEKVLVALTESVKTADLDDLDELADDYKDILDELRDNDRVTAQAIDKATQGLKILKRAPAVIQMYYEYYNRYLGMVNDALKQREGERTPNEVHPTRLMKALSTLLGI